MAKENVKKFVEEVSKNKELQEKIAVAQKGYNPEGKSEEEILEDFLLPIAKEAGYEFSVSEYRGAQRDAMVEKGMSEEELENVSGGGFCVLIGYGKAIVTCAAVGVGRDNDGKNKAEYGTVGVGATDCSGFGVGIGICF